MINYRKRLIYRIFSELYLMGLRGVLFRIRFELRRRLGLDVLTKRKSLLNIPKYLKECPTAPQDSKDYLLWWREKQNSFGFPTPTQARLIMQRLIRQPEKVLDCAFEIHKRNFLWFRHSLQALPKRKAERKDDRNVCSRSHSQSGSGDNRCEPEHGSDLLSAAAPAHS